MTRASFGEEKKPCRAVPLLFVGHSIHYNLSFNAANHIVPSTDTTYTPPKKRVLWLLTTALRPSWDSNPEPLPAENSFQITGK